MLYRAHLTAGTVAGACLAGAAHAAGYARSPESIAAVFALTAAFSLLPDLDTASVVQRWFYRLLFGLLVAMMASGRSAEAAFVATAALLPLVHRHRGWMHRPWAAGVVPLAALLLWGVYWRTVHPEDIASGRLPAAGLIRAMLDNSLYFIAMTWGYLVHLIVDFWIPPLTRRSRIG